VSGNPYLGTGRSAQLSLQNEVLAPRHRRVDLEIEPAGQPGPDGDLLDRAGEPIADARHGQDSLAVGRTQGFAQLCDGVGENVLDGHPTGPDLFQQFFPRDDLARVGEQLAQHLQRF